MIGVYTNYLYIIFVDCGVLLDNTTLDKRLTELLWHRNGTREISGSLLLLEG